MKNLCKFLALFMVAANMGNLVYAQETLTDMSLEDLLNQKIIVASAEEETLAEAPIITNVITAEEIKRMGARNLNEVLDTLPGFSNIQDHNEIYSAERGIYASSQQKILVLRDGHRLNSRDYSEANFGPAISLDNVKRIEVMRGPGATLYGDVALTAVVNIVTLTGKEVNGTEVTAGFGNYGQFKTSLVYGQDLGQNRDLMLWTTLSQTDGEKRSVSAAHDNAAVPEAGTEWLNRFHGAYPNYDMGFNYRTGAVELSVSHRYEDYAMPRTGGGGTGQLIDYDSVRSFAGEGAGASSEFGHYELKYAPVINDNGSVLTVRPYFDTFTFKDNEPQLRADQNAGLGVAKSYAMEWLERSYGLQSSVSNPYKLGLFGTGTLLTGIQVEQMDVYDTFDVHSPDATHPAPNWWMPLTKVLLPGKETSYSAYFQDKHRFSKEWIANVGLRYDYKDRFTGDDVSGLAPRAALIYMPADRLNFRLSYGKSFVDAPFWYRYSQNATGGYSGNPGLKPEWLQTYQATAEYSFLYFINTLNFFYNDFTDVVFRGPTGIYSNAGSVKSKGVEYELGIRRKNLDVRGNYTYQYTDSASGYYTVSNGMISNIPNQMANIIVDYAPLNKMDSTLLKNMWLNVWFRYVGDRFEPIGAANPTFPDYSPNNIDPQYNTINLGVSFEQFLIAGMALRLHVYNLTNTDYVQGGSVSLPYEQPGTWYYGELSYKW